MKDSQNKKIGMGSISLLLLMFGILFSFSWKNTEALGDTILRFLGLNPWSNGEMGTHYTIIYSLIFFIPALILGHKYKSNLGAKLGRNLSLIMIIPGLLLVFYAII
ncbi:hypothetical protein QNH39_18615 [Neobacillus novalis]|uniref:Uncharacterized protein n=1 Tax=Neobacillus novalis TaxID=220687 RepID=A0AA95MP11_9BACI|nr:hypothetical protein [Neobacillus novalis]WHY84651.1 hypothetical protein QNH39_18615 [Neobacillus novalis]